MILEKMAMKKPHHTVIYNHVVSLTGGVEDDLDDDVPGFEGDDAPPLDAQQMSLLMQDQTPLAGAPSPGAAQAGQFYREPKPCWEPLLVDTPSSVTGDVEPK